MSSLDSIPLLSGAVPVLGHGPAFEADRFALLDRVSREIADVGRLRFITRDLVVVNSPESVHEVLVTKARSFEKSPNVRAALYPLVGEGLFTAGGTLWRRQRRLMAPVFQHAKIDAFAAAMVECAHHTTTSWRDGETLEIAAETTRIAMAVAGRTLFGIDTNEEADAIGEALTVALHWTDDSARSIVMALQIELRLKLMDDAGPHVPSRLRAAFDRLIDRLEPPILWPTKQNRKLRDAIALLDGTVQRMIDGRRNSADENQDLLSRLIDARDERDGTGMSDKQMRDEILTLFVAGHETTANGLAWSIYSLARDPQLYARARACVDALYGRKPTIADLPKLELLRTVFEEALRLYPPVYLFGRISTEEVTIRDHVLPKHTVVLVSPWALQRRADVWTDPERFDPDRFAEVNAASKPRDAFIPFSDGPRFCIGKHFAMLEAPLVLATLLQRADFELCSAESPGFSATATLRPRDGVRATVRLRQAHELRSA